MSSSSPSFRVSSLSFVSFSSFAAFTALLNPQDRLMGLGLPDGESLDFFNFFRRSREADDLPLSPS